MKGRLHSASIQLASFGVFCVLYYAPHFLDVSDFLISEPRVRLLFEQALRVPAVQLELLRNVLAHLILLALTYGLLSWAAVRYSLASGLDRSLSRLAFLVGGWILLVSANATLFPLSDYAIVFDQLARPGIAIASSLLLSLALALGLWRSPARRLSLPRLLPVGALGLALLPVAVSSYQADRFTSPTSRDVIIIGVDSLSAATFDAARQYLPNLSQLLDHAINFERAYTPLGRTFPAWMSILSGRSPAEHGAVFNLRNMDHVERRNLVSHDLRSRGYRTVFAIDERRFANIDESFGFDEVIGPKAGALDFVLQRFNDTPLTNLLLQTRLGGALLPYSRLNVASYANYDSKGFVEETLAAASGAQRLFLAVHFESAHFPFRTRHATRKVTEGNRFWNRHVEALTAVDAQVGQLVNGLREHGFLNNALVVVLSDHGESLGEVEATTTRNGEPMDLQAYGHGASVLSEHQNRIILGLIPFREGEPVESGPSRRDELVSLLDIRRAVERYAATGEHVLEPSSTCLPVETGIRFRAAANYTTLSEAELAAESASHYEIDGAGRLRIREDALEELIATKDIGWHCPGRITYFNDAELSYFSYEIGAGDEPFKEVSPRCDDLAQIESYRARLQRSKL